MNEIALFDGCWRHLDAATARRKQLIDAWNAFLDDDPYEVSLAVDDEGVAKLYIEVLTPPPVDLPILFGEFLYHLRAALDHAVYDTAIHDSGRNPPPGANRLEFPITRCEASFRHNAHKIEPLDDRHRRWIEAVQPYRDHDRPESTILHWLNDLARKDRHRTLHFIGAFLTESNPQMQVPEGVQAERDLPLAESIPLLDDYAEVARWRISPHTEAIRRAVRANANAAIDPEIREMAISRSHDDDWPWWPLSRRLDSMTWGVEVIIAYLEKDCTGTTRSKILKDNPSADPRPQSKPPRY